jgi:hypothetical protein
MGDDRFMLYLSSFYRLAGLPPAHYPKDGIEPAPELITDVVLLVSQNFRPSDVVGLDFLQLRKDGANLLATEFGYGHYKGMAADGFTGGSYEASDDESASAHFVAKAHGVRVAAGGVRRPVIHFSEPPLCAQQLNHPFHVGQLAHHPGGIRQRGIHWHNALARQAKAQ